MQRSHALSTLPEAERSYSLAEMQAAAKPVSPRIAALLAPTRTVPRSGDHGFEGLSEIWDARPVTPADMPDLIRQLEQIESALHPAESGACLARIFGLLAHYRQTELPPEVERCVANDFLEDLGEYPLCVLESACRTWRRDPTKFKFRPLPGDLRKICAELTERTTVAATRIRKLLANAERQLPPRDMVDTTGLAARTMDVRARVVALAQARRMP